MIHEKNNSKLKNFEFRAVTIKQLGENTEYTSVPIREAEESYTTIGLYETETKEEGTPVKNHVIDMSIEELLSFYMGKNTPTRQEFIINNLKVELDLVEEENDSAS